MRLMKSEYYELPTKYNQTVVTLLMQSPKCIFAYWDISDDVIKNFSSYDAFLRVINVTKDYFYDISLEPFSNNYYIYVNDTNCTYKVELYRKQNNQIVSLYISNNVHVPSIAPNVDSYTDEVTFRNYLCLANTNKFKVYIPKRFVNQNHTDFENNDIDNISSIDRYNNN